MKYEIFEANQSTMNKNQNWHKSWASCEGRWRQLQFLPLHCNTRPGQLRTDSHWSEGLDWGCQRTASRSQIVGRTDKTYRALACRKSLAETPSTRAGRLLATRRRLRITEWSHPGLHDLQTGPRKTCHESQGSTCPTGSCSHSRSSSGYRTYNITAIPNSPIAAHKVWNLRRQTLSLSVRDNA